MHLADTFIQSNLQLHPGYTFSLVCVPWESNPQLTQCSTTELKKIIISQTHHIIPDSLKLTFTDAGKDKQSDPHAEHLHIRLNSASANVPVFLFRSELKNHVVSATIFNISFPFSVSLTTSTLQHIVREHIINSDKQHMLFLYY